MAFRLLIAALLAGLPMQAATTTTWEMNSYQDFVRGRFSGISLDRDGTLTLAPKLSAIFSTGQSAVWSIAESTGGTLYAGTGHGGALYEITKDGHATQIWKADQPEIFAVAVSPQGHLYAASSPDGQVFSIENGKATPFFNPHAKYIWALAFSSEGAMFVATGNQGKIYRVDPQGKGEEYYSTGQSHVTSLAFDPQGRLLAGTEPNGILYRIVARNKAFVLYDSSLPEIRAMETAPDGTLYVAAMGGSVSNRVGLQSATTASFSAAGSTPSVSVTVTDSTSTDASPELKPKAPAATATTPTPVTPLTGISPIVEIPGAEKSAVYRIHPDNTVETVWTSKDENVYDLRLSGNDLFVATDVQGRVYRLGSDRKASLVVQTGEGETVRLLSSAAGLIAATGDMGKLFRIGSGTADSGWYEAPVHDAGTVARWGRLMWRAGSGATNVRFQTRTGNSARPDATWSDWSKPIADMENNAIQSPNARYIQWRAEFHGPAALDSINVAYLPQNAPPAVRSIVISGANAAASAAKSAASPASTASYSITVTDTGDAPSLSSGTPSQTVGRSGMSQLQVSWQADDPDNDKLVYALYFRGEGEQNWKLLKENQTENVYTMDADSLADGRYFFRVVASDRLSNPPATARDAELVSSPVLIDNTPPLVKIASATRNGSTASIDVDAADTASPLRRCEYSIDAGPWTLVEAADGITDSIHEQFQIHPSGLSTGEHLIVIRVYDSAGNAGLTKTVLK